MLRINGFDNEYLLDLNIYPHEEHTFSVTSEGDNGEKLPWGIEMISCNLVTGETKNNNIINISLDIENLDEECFVLLKNLKRERMKISIKPNVILSAPKTYEFSITEKEAEGRKVKIKILSKENGRDTEWHCTYDGSPLSYSIIPMNSDKSGYVEIKLIDEIYKRMPTVIEFTQVKSGNKLELRLDQGNKDTVIIKAD